MATIKRLSSSASVKNIINYILDKEKTTEKIVSGKDISPYNAALEMNNTKELFGKKEGLSYHHIIQSFKPGEISPEKAHTIGTELAEKQFKGHEVLIATHKDKDHIHNHLIVNSVSFENGRKLIADKASLRQIKLENDKICSRENLSVIHKPYAKERYSMAEYKLAEKGLPIWKEQLRSAIDEARGKSKNMLELKEHLEINFHIEMKIQNKNVSFLHPQKERYCRGQKLGNAYTKEGLTNYFERKNEPEKEKSPIKRTHTDSQMPSFSEIGSGIEKIAQKLSKDIEREKIRAQAKAYHSKREKVKQKERSR